MKYMNSRFILLTLIIALLTEFFLGTMVGAAQGAYPLTSASDYTMAPVLGSTKIKIREFKESTQKSPSIEYNEYKDSNNQYTSQGRLINEYATPQMYGAKGDGITDDTEAMQTCFSSNRFIYIPDGEYCVKGIWSKGSSVNPISNSHILLSSKANIKVIPTSSSTYCGLHLDNVENVIIEGGKITGDWDAHLGEKGEHGHGIKVSHSANITIKDMEITNCWGDSIYVGTTYKNEKEKSYNVRVLNCILHDSRRQGLSVCGCDYFLCDGCEIYNICGKGPRSGIDFEPNINDTDGKTTHANTRCIVTNCYIHDTVGFSIQCYNSSEVLIYKNIIESFENRKNYQPVIFHNNTVNILRIGTEATIRIIDCDIKKRIAMVGSLSGNGKYYFKNSNIIGFNIDNVDGANTPYAEVYFDSCTLMSTDSDDALSAYTSATLLMRPEYKYLEMKNCFLQTGNERGFGKFYGTDGVLIDNCSFKGTAASYIGGQAIYFDINGGDLGAIIKNSTFDVSAVRMGNNGGWNLSSSTLFENNVFKGSSTYLIRSMPTTGNTISFVKNVLPVAEENLFSFFDYDNNTLIKEGNIYR